MTAGPRLNSATPRGPKPWNSAPVTSATSEEDPEPRCFLVLPFVRVKSTDGSVNQQVQSRSGGSRWLLDICS